MKVTTAVEIRFGIMVRLRVTTNGGFGLLGLGLGLDSRIQG